MLKRRTLSFEVKEISDAGEFSGYGSVFGVKDAYDEIVMAGAFQRTLEAWKVRNRLPVLLWQHLSAQPLGLWTLLREDARGLYGEGKILLDAGDVERRAYVHLKAGSVDKLSIGFSLFPDGSRFDPKTGVTYLTAIDLWEISLVTFPANPEAGVDAVKAAIAAGPKDTERLLREAGFSRNQAKALLAGGGYERLTGLREADGEAPALDWTSVLDNVRSLRASMTGDSP